MRKPRLGVELRSSVNAQTGGFKVRTIFKNINGKSSESLKADTHSS